MADIDEIYLRRYLNDVTEIVVPTPQVATEDIAETSTTTYLRRYLNDPAS